jgi:hypothetical protein
VRGYECGGADGCNALIAKRHGVTLVIRLRDELMMMALGCRKDAWSLGCGRYS